jgi:hypothetical protein
MRFRGQRAPEKPGRPAVLVKAGRLAARTAGRLDVAEDATQTRTRLWGQSNRSPSAPRIPAGKKFGEARDRAGIFGHDGPFRATETGLPDVSCAKAPGS